MFKSLTLSAGAHETIIIIIAIFCFLYVIFFAIQKPIFSVYAFLIFWIFVPNAMAGFGEYINFHDLITTIGAISIIIVYFTRISRGFPMYGRKREWHISVKDRYLVKCFILLSLISIGSTALFIYMGYFASVDIVLFIKNNLSLLNGVLFFFGCRFFITDVRHVNTIFRIFFLAGIYLLIEYILCFKLGLIPAIGNYVRSTAGYGEVQFSLILNSHIRVAMILLMSIPSGLYLWMQNKSMAYLILTILFFIPLFETVSRAAFFGGCISFCCYMLFQRRMKIRSVIQVGAILLLLVFIFAYFGEKGAEFLQDATIPKYKLGYDSALTRLGGYLRATEIFFYGFPIGVGEGLSPHNCLNSKIPYLFGDIITNPLVMLTYKYKPTIPHNIVVRLIVEHGVFGAAMLILYIISLVKNYIRYNYYKSKIAGSRVNQQSDNIMDATYAALFGLFCFHMFDAVHMLYFVYGVLLVFSFAAVSLIKMEALRSINSKKG